MNEQDLEVTTNIAEDAVGLGRVGKGLLRRSVPSFPGGADPSRLGPAGEQWRSVQLVTLLRAAGTLSARSCSSSRGGSLRYHH